MKHLLKQAKEFEKALSDESVIEKEEVVKVMKDKWQAARSEDRDIAGMGWYSSLAVCFRQSLILGSI